MKPLREKKCEPKGSLGREALIPNLGGTPICSIPISFKTRGNYLKEVGRGSFVTSASSTSVNLVEVLGGNVMVVVNLGT